MSLYMIKLTQSNLVQHLRLVVLLGWMDVQQTYKRSRIGAFWVTIGSAVGIVTVSLVYGLIFRLDLTDFLPYISISMVAWAFLANTLAESCNAYIVAEGIIKQLPVPLLVHNLRVIWRNIAVMGHTIVIYPIILIFVGFQPDAAMFLFIPGLLLACINVGWVGILLAIASARFRDLGPVVANVLQVAFYLTPVIWLADSMPAEIAHWVLGLNPLYHLLQIVRLPLLGEWPTPENWLISLALAFVGYFISALAYVKFKNKIALWV